MIPDVPSAEISFGMLFITSSILKRHRLMAVERTIYALSFYVRRAARVLAIVSVAAEGLLGALLLTGVAPEVSSLVTSAVFLAFDAILWRLRVRGFSDACGCMGSLDNSRIGPLTYIRNFVLTSAALSLSFLVIGSHSQIRFSFASYVKGIAVFAFMFSMYVVAIHFNRMKVSKQP